MVRRSRCVSRAPALSRSAVIISSRECTVSSISSCVGVIASSGTSSSSRSVFPSLSFLSLAPTRARVASSRSSTNLLLSDTSSLTRICVSIRSSCVSRSSVWSDAWKESCARRLAGSTIPATTVCVALSTLRAPPCFLGDSRCAAADVASAILPSAVSALSDVRIKSSTRTHCFGSLFAESLRADERLCFFESDGSFGIVASSAVWSSPLSRARVSEDRRPCAPRSSEWWLPRCSSLAMLSARRGASP